MKHKFAKTALIIAVVSLAVGGVCLGAGLAMGGSPSFYYDEDGIHVKENAASDRAQSYVMEYTKLDALKNLDISLFDADLKIVSGKDWGVEYVLNGSRMEPEYSLEGQTLKIRENQSGKTGQIRSFGWGHFWWYNGDQEQTTPYVKLTVPENAKLEEVSIVSEYGDVSIEEKLEADDVTFDMVYGALTVGTVKSGSLTVKNETGKVSVDALQVEKASFELEYGDLSATVGAASDLKVESESGSVTLKLVGGMEEYGVSLHTDYGTIRTPQGVVEADEYEGCSDFIRLADDAADIHIYTESGDIRVRDDA